MTIEELSKELVDAEQVLQGHLRQNVYGLKPGDLIQMRVDYIKAQIRYNKARSAMNEFIERESK